eukprot:scaffold4212_cov122-Isochrysis_galbana.AAC.14
MEGFGVCGVFYCSSVERMRMCLPTCPILAMSRRLAIRSDMERVRGRMSYPPRWAPAGAGEAPS